MKTEQEQIEAIYNLIISHLFEDTVYSLAEQIYEAGYGDVSEYKAEIERLRTILGQCNTELNSALESLKSQCREIGKLKAEVKQAKINALIELEEKIVEHMGEREYMGVKYKQGVFSESEIDEILKEVQNAENKS